ncbi:MAG TPA: nuclear transport factor 2 family protein [Gemmatimonadaceae bacterium]|jgi:hypothetical protein|nr:nuclear transport factor 2 family protein [Gemmatimonadaceae bacterium]
MLRSLTRSMLLLALIAGAIQAQKKKEKDVKPGAVELIRLENAWADGLVKRDTALFERLLAQKFVYTENDKLTRRAETLHDLVAGGDTVTAARNEGMEVHQFGAVTAVVTGWLIVEGRSKGAAFTHRYRFTDTWVKRQSRWQIVAAQDYLAPK